MSPESDGRSMDDVMASIRAMMRTKPNGTLSLEEILALRTKMPIKPRLVAAKTAAGRSWPSLNLHGTSKAGHLTPADITPGTWHDSVRDYVAALVSRGMSDTEIHRIVDEPFTMPPHTVDKTFREVQQFIDGARRKAFDQRPTFAAPQPIEPTTAEQQRRASSIKATPYVWVPPALVALPDFIYGDFYIRKRMTATVAPGGLGKSSLIIAEGLSMVSGKRLLHHEVPRRARVWLVNLEDPKEELERRIQAHALYHGLESGDLDGLFVDGSDTIALVMAERDKGGAFIVRPVADAIEREIRANGIDVMSVDPFVYSHRVGEKENDDIAVVAQEWADIASRTNASIHLVHHTRKLNGEEADAEDSRGGSALVAAARSVKVLNRMKPDQAKQWNESDNRVLFRVYNDKFNLGPPADRSEWYKIESVRLKPGKGGSVGVITAWKPPDDFNGISSAAIDRAIAALAACPRRYDARATDWAGHVVGEALALDTRKEESGGNRSRIVRMIEKWIRNGLLEVFSQAGKRTNGATAEFQFVRVIATRNSP